MDPEKDELITTSIDYNIHDINSDFLLPMGNPGFPRSKGKEPGDGGFVQAGNDRPARRSETGPRDQCEGGPDLPDDVVRVPRHGARRAPLRACGVRQHLPPDHEPDPRRPRAEDRPAGG